MKAVRLIAHGSPGRREWQTVPDPRAARDEVVLEVKACGLNHLDLWVEQGDLPVPIALPRIQGCEVAGRILELGADVDEWRVGDRVAVQSNLFCGQCEYCRRGDESICLKGKIIGVDRDGGFAERTVVPARALVAVPEGVGDVDAAGLTLAASTAMHMLTNRAEVKTGDWVLVVGAASGVGSAAVQIAKERGGRVIATASSAPKRDLAHRLGAEAVIDSTSPDWPRQVREATGKRGVDLVVEHIGGPVLAGVFHCLARGGTVVSCGATAGREPPIDLWPFFVKQHRLIGSYGRNREDLETTLRWAAEGRIRAVIDSILPLEKAGEAFRVLRERTVRGKVIIQPG